MILHFGPTCCDGRKHGENLLWRKNVNKMEQRMECKMAIEIIRNFIDTIDPFTGKLLDPNNRYVNVEIVKALQEAVKVLKVEARKNRTTRTPSRKELHERLERLEKLLNVKNESDINRKRINPQDGLTHRPDRASSKWSTEESELLKQRFQGGLSLSQLADKHQRTRVAIAARLVRLGLIEERKDVLRKTY